MHDADGRRRRLPRSTAAVVAWVTAAVSSGLAVQHSALVPVAVFAVGAAVALTVLYARKRSEAAAQASFMAGVMHERATGDSEQLPLAAGQTMGIVMRLPDQRGRKPRPRHRS